MPTAWNGDPITLEDIAARLKKPGRGTAKLERIRRGKTADAKEDAQKQKVRKRDGHCRWPHLTPDAQELCQRTGREVAHLTHKGIGGDPQTIRSKAHLMIAVDRNIHQGPGSLHAGDKRVVFLSEKKADGPLAFLERRGGKWVEIGRELWPGVLAPAKDVR
jgi:hypothetical protein